MKTNNPIEKVLTRGVEHIYPNREALEKALRSGKKLRVYQGIDPTGKLHLGHIVGLRKLRQLQDLGHEIIVLIGDFTATIGDPTSKRTTRKPLTREEVLANAKDYKKQVGKILDLTKSNIRFLHNEKWSSKLKPADMLELASKFTVAGLLERDMFQERIKAGRDIRVHEFLYPIFQAYDSMTMDVDLEVGGNDQTFNMLAGRTLSRKVKNKEKFVLALKLLVDPSGKKMGKSEDNSVFLDDKPDKMYGKIMAWPDELIGLGFELLTNIPKEEIEKITRQIKSKKLNPREAKARLAREIVAICHNPKAASLAEKEFVRVFQKKQLPSRIQKIKARRQTPLPLYKTIAELFSVSGAEAQRVIEQGGVKIEGVVQKDPRLIFKPRSGMVIQVGKRRTLQIM